MLDENTLLLVISQSGETADTIAALREAKERGAMVLSICNVQGSMITREADGTILTHAGPEIGVASTKAFTSQMIALYLFALYLGQLRGTLDREQSLAHVRQLAELPVKMEQLLNEAEAIEELSKEFFRATDFLYLGRGINFPIALEGALKLKEISYIHAEGYAGRRNETRSQCAHRRAFTRDVHQYARGRQSRVRAALREDAFEHCRSKSARRNNHLNSH